MRKTLFCILLPIAAVWAQNVSPSINSLPSREFGQPALLNSLNSRAPNLVEGRELNQPYALAFDTNASPNILYVVDGANNRVLGFKNPNNLTPCGQNNLGCGMADFVIGPRPGDFTTTFPGGPNAVSPAVSAGFSLPIAAAVDANGNLYVIDSGNNRILRFPSPLKQTGALWSTDLVIGQKSVVSGTLPNQGQQNPSAGSLFLSSNGTSFNSGLTIEAVTGALWVTDPGNNRVLRFPVGQLTANTSQPQADLVIGQSNFTTQAAQQPPTGTLTPLFTTALYQPDGITFDAKGRLYVSDGLTNSFYRVMFFNGGYSTGMAATRILGLDFQLTSTQLKYPNNYALAGPVGLATVGNNLWVCDFGQHRIVEYDVFENWPAAGTQNANGIFSAEPSPPMIAVIGQNSLTTSCQVNNCANKGQATPDSSTLDFPAGIAVNGTDIWIADTGNNRVLGFSANGTTYTTASHLVGQVDYPYNSPNLIEGREVNFPSSVVLAGIGLPFGGGGVAIDHNSNPPHLYIADTANNRVLCFNDARSKPTRADLVLGQTDFYSALANQPLNDTTTMTPGGLNLPTDVAVDANGNLWVADALNGRVLRFPAPFSQPSGTKIMPNVVLGQVGFAGTPIRDASIENMSVPFGLAIFSNGALAVSDAALNRILVFKNAPGADFQNSQAASFVLGQSDFQGSNAGNSTASLFSPRHMGVDTSDRLYVADGGNNRMLIYNNGANLSNGAAASLQFTAFNGPQGIRVSSLTGEVWVADSNDGILYRLPEYDTLSLNPNQVTATIHTQTQPVAVELDNSDNVVISELANRVTFYYASLAYRNPASFNAQPLAPGMIAIIGRNGKDFSLTASGTQITPLPPQAADVQVLVNGQASPIVYVAPTIIAFQVPSATPSSGTATITVQRASTGEILGSTSAQMQPFNPGIFTLNAQGFGQAAATNADGTINGPGNPIVADGKHLITFYLTGGGVFQGLTDGTISSTGVSTSVRPVLLTNDGGFPNNTIPDADIQYSGSSFYPGEWQINMYVDSKYPPGTHTIVVTMNGLASSIGPNGQPGSITVNFVTK